jgi:MFS family permease
MAQKGGWAIVALLFFFMMINFADKAIIGLAGVPIMKELNLTPKEFGLVNSSFFFLFSVSAIINRLRRQPCSIALGAVGDGGHLVPDTVPLVGTASLATLIACRIVLGAGEGPAYPVALHALYKWFPNELRTQPTAIFAQGASIGVVLAIPILNYVIERFPGIGPLACWGSLVSYG